MVYKGTVTAKVVDVRFGNGGKVVSVTKHIGDTVTKGELIASLDRIILQKELEMQLADSEKARADFSAFVEKYPDPQDENKFTKVEKQAALNSSVKEVEIAKSNLDMCDLFSPVNGVITDDSGITVGQNITPAGGSVKIIDTDSYLFEFSIEQKLIIEFREKRICRVNIDGLETKIDGASAPVYSDGKEFIVKVKMVASPGLLAGMTGMAEF
jgi:multidrug resistance efflux pump